MVSIQVIIYCSYLLRCSDMFTNKHLCFALFTLCSYLKLCTL